MQPADCFRKSSYLLFGGGLSGRVRMVGSESKERTKTLFPERTLPDDPIINLLRKADTMHFNDIILALKCSPAELSGRLFDLELDGYIEAIPGGRYAIALK